KPTAPRSPRQNPYVERLIGTIRRECLDHMIVFGEAHLRRILGRYAAYYNESRIHRSLDKDAPTPGLCEAVTRWLSGGYAQSVQQALSARSGGGLAAAWARGVQAGSAGEQPSTRRHRWSSSFSSS